MLRQIVKIANKLDSLGLTKEADVLDRYIQKVAQESYQETDYGMSQDSPYDRIMRDEKLKDAEQRAQTYQYEQKEMKLAESISENVIFNTPDYLKASPATFKDSFMKAWLSSTNPRGSFSNQEAWKDTGTKMANKMWDKYGRSDAGTAEKPPVVPEDPWAKSYGSRARELKSVWIKRTTATKKNPSFDNFQAWLKSRRLERGGVDAIIQKLIMETSTAIGEKVEGQAPTFADITSSPTPSSSPQATSPASGGPVTPEPSAPDAYRAGNIDRTDARLPR